MNTEKISRVLQVFSALFCLTDAIIRFVYIKPVLSWTVVCISIYLLVFASIILLVEFTQYFKTLFAFMTTPSGIITFNGLVASLCLSSGMHVHWFDIMTGVFLVVVSIGWYGCMVHRMNASNPPEVKNVLSNQI